MLKVNSFYKIILIKPFVFFLLGFSCIHLASMFGHTSIVAYLVAKGEDVDLPDKFGVTPLMHSAYRITKYNEIFF